MKKYSRFAAAALTSAMMMASMGTAVFADGDEETSNPDMQAALSITKNVLVRENTSKPSTTFSFTIRSAKDDELNKTSVKGLDKNELTETSDIASETGQVQPILSGPSDGLQYKNSNNQYVGTAVIPFVPRQDTVGSPTPVEGTEPTQYQYTGTAKLYINQSVFKNADGTESAPGIYRYVIEEVPGDYDGMEYNSEDIQYYVDVYKTYKEGSTKEYEYSYVAMKVTTTETTDDEETTKEVSLEKSDVIFTNDFSNDGDDPENPDPDKGTREITLKKNVTGNQGEINKEFGFTFTVTASTDNGDSLTSNEVYNYQKFSSDDKPNGNMMIAKSGEAVTNLTLAHGEYIKIYGVSPNDRVVTDETEQFKNQNGYTTTVTGGDKVKKTDENGNDIVDSDGKTIMVDTGNLNSKISKDTDIVWTNNKNVTTPAGVLLTAAPYAAVVALGGVFAGLFFRRKRED